MKKRLVLYLAFAAAFFALAPLTAGPRRGRREAVHFGEISPTKHVTIVTDSKQRVTYNLAHFEVIDETGLDMPHVLYIGDRVRFDYDYQGKPVSVEGKVESISGG